MFCVIALVGTKIKKISNIGPLGRDDTIRSINDTDNYPSI